MTDTSNTSQGSKKFEVKPFAIAEWVDNLLSNYWGIALFAFFFLVNSHMPNGQMTADMVQYRDNIFGIFSTTAFIALAVAFFESYKRNEMWDIVKVVVALGVGYASLHF